MIWKRRRALNQKFDSELKFHLDQLIQEKIASGTPEDEARRQAILEFGGPEQLKEELRDIHRLPFLETTLANFQFALRLIRKSPSFSITVILTLALGIGANSAVFSAIDAILIRPLPFPKSSELVELRQFDHTAKGPFISAAPARVEDWNRLSRSFQAITGYYTSDVSDTSGSLPEKVTEALVAPRFLQVWGVSPALGRDFTSEEQRFGGPSAIIISHRLWMHRFYGDPRAIGKQLRLEQNSATVIGVMPAGFAFLDHDVDIWSPSPVDAPFAQDRSETWYYKVVGRLKPGISPSAAHAELANIQAQLGRQYPKTDQKLSVEVQSLKDLFVGDAQDSLWLLYGAVSLLLLIACINIAALLLARAAEREREISVRYSLGASRATIIHQLLCECFLFAIIGSALGLFVASTGAALLRNYAKGFPRHDEITLNWHIVLYTLFCAIVATLLCGLVPAIRGTRRNISSTLNQFTRSQVSSRNPIQWLLVATQICLAVTLLLGAGLMLRSFQELDRISPGFETSHILTLRVSGNWGETTDMKTLTQRIDRTLAVLRATPGVVAAATTAMLPGIPSDNFTQIKISDAPTQSGVKISADTRFVSDDYFATLKIPVLAGVPCPASSTALTVIINHSFANTYLGNVIPLGRHIQLQSDTFALPAAEIKGIVADTRDQGVNKSPAPTIYWCGSAPFPTPYFLIQTRSDPMSMAQPLRQRIHLLEPSRSVYGISPLEIHLSDNFAPNRLRTFLLSAFAFSAIALAATGLYGTLSYFVAVRRRECGLRLALGARQTQIVSDFFVKGLAIALAGCAAGLSLSAASTKLLSGMLFGISSTDLPTWSAVTIGVLAVASAASLIPALRAANVEPMQVLRDE
jgi:predicted permease